jgi:hypothetical protein
MLKTSNKIFQIVDYLIKNKADIEAKSTDGYTPLQKAALGTPSWQKEGPGVNFFNVLQAA